jgi:N-acetylmuramoyl-L-alanine amidase
VLEGLKAVVDVQHIYRSGIHRWDRGTVYRLATGGKVNEADCAVHYAQTLAAQLRSWGALVWSNEPKSGILVGPYATRQIAATALGANLYLACHLNAGRGTYALVEYMDGGLGAAVGKAITSELANSLPEVDSGKVVVLEPTDRGAVCIRGFTAGPSVILEPLFGDNAVHQRLLSLAGLEMVGLGVARGVATWWRQSRPMVLVP